MKTLSPLDAARHTLRDHPGDAPELVALAAAVKELDDATARRDAVADTIPAATAAVADAQAAWVAEQSPARWRTVEQAKLRADAARGQLVALEAGAARALEALGPALVAALTAERAALAASFEKTAGAQLVEYARHARAIERAAQDLALTVADARDHSEDLLVRLRVAGVVAADQGTPPPDMRVKLSAHDLAGTMLAETDLAGWRRGDCLHASSPMDHLAGKRSKGGPLDRRAIDAATRAMEPASNPFTLAPQPPEAA